MSEPMDRELPDKVIEVIKKRHKIEAIKLLREEWGLSLEEAKDCVDDYINGNKGLPPVRSRISETGLVRFIMIILTLIVLAAAYYYL